MSNNNDSQQWLIRTSKNWIAGPYAKLQIIQMIQDGSLGLEDEFCVGSGYWISVNDREEVKNSLGIAFSQKNTNAVDSEEITETQVNLYENEELENKSIPKKNIFATQLPFSSDAHLTPEVVGKSEKNSIWRFTLVLGFFIAALLILCVMLLK